MLSSKYQKRQRAQQATAVVGIDAGKHRHALVVRPRGGEDTRPMLFTADRAGFERALAEIHDQTGGAAPSDILVGIEFAGNYGFTLAHFLDRQGYGVVSVLPAHTRRWKEVMHGQNLKTDPHDALGIADLTAQGHFVGFPFLDPVYADLRYLVSTRERLTRLRTAAIARLKGILQVVWPEFEDRFKDFSKKTPLALLRAFPGPQALLDAPQRRVLKLIGSVSRGHLGLATYEELVERAEATIALPGAQGVLREEIPLQLELLDTYERQLQAVDASMVGALDQAPEADALLSIPKLGQVMAAVFLGSIGDPQAYDSSRQILRVAGTTTAVGRSRRSWPSAARCSAWHTAWPATGGSTFPTPPGNRTASFCIGPVAGEGTHLRPHSARTQAGGWSP
ncbi:MAG: transposase [Gemmatimonadota bacterium]